MSNMDDLNELKAFGEGLGLKDTALADFIKEQQAIRRDERQAQRELEKIKMHAQADAEREKYNFELEREKVKIDIEKMKLEQHSYIASESKSYDSHVSAKIPKLPFFDDSHDEMDSYLLRFERYAEAQRWDRSDWAINLSALLKGKALDVYALMPKTDAFDYNTLKTALLRRFELTDDGFKKKFRSCRPDPSETFSQFAVRLSSYFDRWIEMAKVSKSFEDLYDLMLRDQFLHVCSQDLKLFLKERLPENLTRMANLADQYKDARDLNALQATGKGKMPSAKKVDQVKKTDVGENKHVPNDKKRFIPKTERKCYKCHRYGHIAPECKSRTSFNNVSNAVQDFGSSEQKVCFVSTMPTDSIVDSRVSSSPMTMSSSCQKNSSFNMPLSAGYVNNVPVTVLRDTGCSGIVVKMSKIQEENLIVGKKQTCILADGSKVSVPIAKVSIDTPFLKGQYEVWCMENPVYDLIVGNVPDAKPADQPDPDWQVNAVETRQQKRDKSKPYPQLRVPDMITEDINPMTIRDAQEHDHSLKKVPENVENNLSQVKKNGKVSWFKKNDLMFRQYSTHVGDREKSYSQLVVPDKFRNQVMKLAHDSLLAGHLGTQRTLARVTSEFWWPGIQSDVRRFCQSCDICQRTVHKGKIKKVPLERMPLIDEPFQRVAVDLVGPLSPITDKGNRYILTLVDYATRYPEAIALPSIETERIAEALFEMFSRIGIPREMLTDMGAQFTSALMSEVSRLISLSQRTTTPYHPSCNGLVERFNGTLKQMLKRLCFEKPKDWDKYLSAVLFAYREVPQESLGFSPFELVYGRSVRGPISILKELWTNDIPDPNVKTTYQYVLDLKDRLQSMAELAKESLEKSSTRYKKHYDRKTRTRSLKVGDKALVLLPTDNNKLLLQWKGPFVVTKKVNRVDYQLDMQGKTKTFHINLLKKYIERPISDVASVTEDAGVLGLVNAAVVDCVDDEDQDGQLDEYPQSQVSVSTVNINPSLSLESKDRLMKLLFKFDDVFQDSPGITSVLEHEIRTTSAKPIHVKNRQIPYSMEETVNKEVSDMLKMNIIESSDSPYCSPVVIVPKKDGTNRFCIDFRLLNNQTIFDSEPMPDADEMFSKLAGHKFFSKIDLSKGYWQVKLTDDSKPKTAFRTGKGLFQFRVMPFGLVTAPATFSRLMRKVLHGMENVDNFIDDILVYTKSLDHHFVVLDELFQRLRTAGLTAKPGKCSLAYSNIDCLGHVVGNEELKPDFDKVEAICNAPIPVTKKQLRSFLGLVGFYRKFVPNFAQIASPLTDLTKKGLPTKLKWEDAHNLAFQTLKASLTKCPILKLSDIKETFILQTDASDRGLGAVLLQEEMGQKLPIAYASRKLRESECKYATVEKECLAVVWAIQKFQKYLYGHAFILETDHSPLVYLNKAKVTNPRLMRWTLSLQPYRFAIHAIKGKDNVGADYLSRLM
ncbi:uncharacterized protein LOC128170699 isoform X2 [Crassostrea angulata]|nr:uncharacterized protein LOC128170699 isoform X2 [Crassostrea angulata]XP_052692423.1 uncharacterized protein LOC128170699 isoform X2 [Crassostrea angulata]